jgi:hypothetical protein
MRGLARKLTAGATAFAFLVLTAIPPALALPPCFRTADIEADQALRYQARLMVLSDTCGGDAYRDFTVRNRDLIVAYQRQLIDRYRRLGVRQPESSLDTFLTHIANERALHDGVELRQVLCTRDASVLAESRTFDRDSFRNYVTQLAATNSATYRRCK